MFTKIAVVAALAASVFAAPQGVTSAIAPTATAPAGCKASYASAFNIEVVNASTVKTKRSVEKRADALTITLANSVLTDSKGRTGYIAANYQFQFDGPAQTGAIYTAGWSVCSNGSLALGGSNIFYQCLSGDFYNLYDRSWAPQCSPILIQVVDVSSNTTTSAGAATTASASKSSMAGSVVTQITDGQVQASTVVTLTSTSSAASQTKASSTAVVTQITDGQIQATSAASYSSSKTSSTVVVSQITDGQIQASSAASYSSSKTSSAPAMFTGAANIRSYANELVAVAAGAAAIALL